MLQESVSPKRRLWTGWPVTIRGDLRAVFISLLYRQKVSWRLPKDELCVNTPKATHPPSVHGRTVR